MPRAAKHHSVKSPLPMDATISQRIRAQRLNRKLSQTELANALGVTFQQVQKYEKGVNRVGSGRLQQIAETLGVTPAFFFDGAEAGGASKSDAKAIAGAAATFFFSATCDMGCLVWALRGGRADLPGLTPIIPPGGSKGRIFLPDAVHTAGRIAALGSFGYA
jgi:transcriptional regulator with XRE-family HTH domain